VLETPERNLEAWVDQNDISHASASRPEMDQPRPPLRLFFDRDAPPSMASFVAEQTAAIAAVA
jgi:hypothetical protein